MKTVYILKAEDRLFWKSMESSWWNLQNSGQRDYRVPWRWDWQSVNIHLLQEHLRIHWRSYYWYAYQDSDLMEIFEDQEVKLMNLKMCLVLLLKTQLITIQDKNPQEDIPEDDDVVKPSDREDKFCKKDKSGAWNSSWRFREADRRDGTPAGRVFCRLAGFSLVVLMRSISRAFMIRRLELWSLLKKSKLTSRIGPSKGSTRSFAAASGWDAPRGCTSRLAAASSSSSVRSSLRESPEEKSWKCKIETAWWRLTSWRKLYIGEINLEGWASTEGDTNVMSSHELVEEFLEDRFNLAEDQGIFSWRLEGTKNFFFKNQPTILSLQGLLLKMQTVTA